jgi:HEAT repeat protein
MSPSSISRLALFVSVVGLALALVAFSTGNEEPRRTPAGGTDSPDRAEESARRIQALTDEIDALRGQLASLKETVERLSPGQRVAVETTGERAPAAVSTLEARAVDSPAEFQLRRELLDGFYELDKGDREDAIERLAELARWGDEEAMALIVESLRDESATVRAHALKELVGLDEANLADYLRQSITDPSHKVREVVASRLDDLPADQAGPMLVDLLRDPDHGVVIEAIRSLDDLRYAEARPVLVEKLKSTNLDVATRAAQALVKLGDAGAAGGTIERILAELAQEDVPGRIKNVKRLRRLRAVNALERIYESDPSLAVREEAREALVHIEE